MLSKISAYVGLLACGWLSVVAPSAAADQNWPDQPIRFIVSQPAGAGPDIMARLVGNFVGEYLGRPDIVENKPGGGNAIGATTAARSAADGYTFFFADFCSARHQPVHDAVATIRYGKGLCASRAGRQKQSNSGFPSRSHGVVLERFTGPRKARSGKTCYRSRWSS